MKLLRSMIFIIFTSIGLQSFAQKQIYLADPTIFHSQKTYYLYGTVGGGPWHDGFTVYTSTDKKNWKYNGIALKKGDAFGASGFWAPQVFEHQHHFYMAYVANEHIAIAESDSPLGPFTQKIKVPIDSSQKTIDPFVFFDDGKIYLYHVRLGQGNRIFVTEVNADLASIKPGTLKECIHADTPWENTAKSTWPVTEGPTVLKRKGTYYLFYSANDFRNPDYAVGYATSKSPIGPWQKYKGNPILSKTETGVNGTGHGDFFKDQNGTWDYVFHTHYANQKVSPRKTALIETRFQKQKNGPDELVMLPKTIEFLKEK